MRWIVALFLLTACGDDVHVTTAPTHCESITRRGLHADTTVTECK